MSFSIDHVDIDVPCPRCGFWNSVTIRQIRTRDVLICRGCKANLQLEDHMNEARSAERSIRSSMDRLTDMLGTIGRIEIRL
jgi:transcription elongation factor Elf1